MAEVKRYFERGNTIGRRVDKYMVYHFVERFVFLISRIVVIYNLRIAKKEKCLLFSLGKHSSPSASVGGGAMYNPNPPLLVQVPQLPCHHQSQHPPYPLPCPPSC